MASKKQEYLDANWLLGEDPSPRSGWGSLWSGTVFALFVAAVAVWSWPYVSKWYLQRQFAFSLRQTQDPNESLESLEALSLLMPESVPDIVHGLCSDNQETGEYAFKLLDQFLSKTIQEGDPNHRATLQTVLYTLERNRNRFSAIGIPRAKLLTARIYEACAKDTNPIGAQVASRAESLMLVLTSIETTSVTSQLTSNSASFSPPTTLVPLPAAQEEVQASVSSPLEGAATRVSMRIHSGDESVAEPSEPGISNELEQPVLIASIPSRNRNPRARTVGGSSSTVVQAVDQTETLQESAEANRRSSTPGEEASMQVPAPRDIAGLREYSTVDLVRSLSSVQRDIAEAAYSELERREWAPEQLELAWILARGTTEQRLESMQKLVRSGEIAPIPWLRWMAEDGDRVVRERAVILLGTLADVNASAQLRLLLNRENDDGIRDRIQRILAASANRTERNTSLR